MTVPHMSVLHVLQGQEPYYRIEEIRGVDPLGADEACEKLRVMNADGDVSGMVTSLRELLPATAVLDDLSTIENIAAMRDLGIFLGSIKRHGTEPLDAVPEALPVLRALGRRTGMVPRDTVHHYTAWNPVGARQRMYTGDPMEACLQDAVRMVFPSLCAALDTCSELATLEPHDHRFSSCLDRLAGLVQAMVDSIDFTIANVSPVFFARVLRPYFEEITLDGQEYLGPAAAQVPLWLVDLTLWQSDRGTGRYDTFLAESVPYSLPAWRTFHARYQGCPSAVGKLSFAISWEEADRLPPTLRASAVALARVLRILKTFRARHIRIAREAYSDEVRLYDNGSGGAPVELLRSVLDLTRENETLVRRSTEGER